MLDLFSIVHGRVISLKEYGAFIAVDGCTEQGLLHKSQISDYRVDNVAEVLDVDEQMYCKVISVKDGKISFSMKLVDQKTGRDKDPNHIIASQLSKQERGSRSAPDPVRADAEVNTVCQRCGGKGHFAINCFSSKGQKAWDLLVSSEDEEPALPYQGVLKRTSCKSTGKRKRDSSSPEAPKKKKSKKKKHKKSKKHKST